MDVLTLSIVNAFIAATFAALLVLQYKSERQFRYQRYFILAAVLMLVNALLSTVNGSITSLPYWLVPALSNTCSVGAHLALACGIHRHLQLSAKRQWLLLLLIPIYLIQLTDFASSATANRMLFAIPLVLAFNLWSINMLWRQRHSELGRVYLAFIATFAFNIIQFTLRSTYMLLEHFQIVHTQQSALIHSIGFFSLTAFAILMIGCVIMLSHSQQRLALLHVSERDALTGLLNRRSLQTRLVAELNRGQRSGTTLSLLLFDIDHFKQVNDQHGHKTGDRAIMHVVDIASEQLRDYDLLFRYGGEEFLLCLPDTDEATAILIAERLRKAVAYTAMAVEPNLKMTISIGISSTSTFAEPDELIEQTDIALYNAKHTGRNKVVVYQQP
ncbi:GGDEF domain-containing protein [Rheinheimera baltica]|uniref:GGDEF domain-containing protein n=1 Tax=Rheinheimera baltica TaxID=67576 RepID=UPI00273DDE88|nr:GGDEF domain-containing protein [Rheinheimera baltica]MDP5141164.1 GGDEF domain-containing protein [Rheinheimera baltica]